MTSRTFRIRLAAITGAALVLRVVYVLVARRNTAVWGDAFYYHESANLLAHGHAFIDPIRYAFGRVSQPSAQHPPLYTAYLGLWSRIGVSSPLGHRLVTCLVGAATVALLGLLGHRLAGARAGLLAAGFAAVYPPLFLNDGQLLSETVTACTIAALMLTVERFRRAPSAVNAAIVGAVTAIATLSRAELVLLFVLLAFPLVLVGRNIAGRARLARLGACALAGAIVLAPWVGWNLVRFHHPELVSSGFGSALYAGTCDPAFEGSTIGYWGGLGCDLSTVRLPPVDAATLDRWRRDPAGTAAERTAYYRKAFESDRDAQGRVKDESDVDVASRRAALDYVRAHSQRVPLVVAARLGRIWYAFKPVQDVDFDATGDGRGPIGAWAGFVASFLFGAAAIAGLVVLRRRRHPVWPYLMLVAEVCITVAITYGIQRFRIPVDTVIPALAAVAVAALLPSFSPAGSRPSVPEEQLV